MSNLIPEHTFEPRNWLHASMNRTDASVHFTMNVSRAHEQSKKQAFSSKADECIRRLRKFDIVKCHDPMHPAFVIKQALSRQIPVSCYMKIEDNRTIPVIEGTLLLTFIAFDHECEIFLFSNRSSTNRFGPNNTTRSFALFEEVKLGGKIIIIAVAERLPYFLIGEKTFFALDGIPL